MAFVKRWAYLNIVALQPAFDKPGDVACEVVSCVWVVWQTEEQSNGFLRPIFIQPKYFKPVKCRYRNHNTVLQTRWLHRVSHKQGVNSSHSITRRDSKWWRFDYSRFVKLIDHTLFMWQVKLIRRFNVNVINWLFYRSYYTGGAFFDKYC